VLVVGGVITAYLGMTHVFQATGQCGSVTVGLAPFGDTSNPGGEYKVWMTPRADFETYGGFVHSRSKTDNFKVVAPEPPGGD
jgi:hypothetical protein